MVPKKVAPALSGLVLSGRMSLLVSGMATFRATGLVHGVIGLWATSWFTASRVALPVVLVVAPFTRRMGDAVVASE